VETDDTTLPARLRQHLANTLPPSAVPSVIMARPSLPRTASGKIDRFSLAHADTTVERAEPQVAPLPDDVARWWQEQTGAPADGTADFFASGGDSLSALLLVQLINETYGTEITIGAFYADPTTRFLSTAVPSRSSS
jgi:hypothetical protein